MLVHPAVCLQKLAKVCMRLKLTDEELYKVERYFQNTNEQERAEIFELTRQKLKEYTEQNSKQMRKLSTLIAAASVICKNTSMLDFVPATSTSNSKQISDKDVIDILKSFDLRRFNREVQDKKDQRNNRRNKK